MQTVGGLLQGVLLALNITLLDVRADSVSVLAADPSVSYISLDTQVRTFGHVTNTTGAQQSRAQKTALGLNYTLDGSGVSIAILDSESTSRISLSPVRRAKLLSAKTSRAKIALTIPTVMAPTWLP